MSEMYADIIPGISLEQLDKTFQYLVPEELKHSISPGSVVKVPFGGGGRHITGFVVGLSGIPAIEPERIKPVAEVLTDKELPESRIIAIAAWMKDEYGCTMSQALKTVLPVKEKVQKKEIKILQISTDTDMVNGYLERMKQKNARARVRLLEALIHSGSLDMQTAAKELKISSKTVNDLKEAGVIAVQSTFEYRNPVEDAGDICKEQISLNAEQSTLVEGFLRDYEAGERRPVLIHGVTGSGKTLCYIEMISHVVAQGKQAIVLIPEIALTWQTVRRFQARFGDRVSILNSRMSKGERYDQFLRAARGDMDVIIGPRSALFTPFKDIGMMIIDEEHESSYKSETVPAYHARETAEFIAGLHGAALVLGSATPSVTSYYRAVKGVYKLYSLKNRAAGELPECYVEDMRAELAAGNRGMFSRRLLAAIEDRLSKKEQIMLFINKRGYAGFVSCKSCGHVFKCPHCDVSLTFHKGNKLVCHYCGYEEEQAGKCPKCGSAYVYGLRAGTQKVEDSIKKLFPSARVLRMDKDTTSGKEGHTRVLSEFAEGNADILIGTQMIVKGHDFPRVTLVSALAADMSLFAGDYRAAEVTFELLVQAAGRAGRGNRKGEMIIQTYAPENYAVCHAAQQDYTGFFSEEIRFREMMNYPPAAFMIKLSLSGKNEEEVIAAVSVLKERFFSGSLEEMGVNVIGPAKEPVYRIADEYRMAVYMKSKDKEMLDGIRRTIDGFIRSETVFKGVFIRWDIE